MSQNNPTIGSGKSGTEYREADNNRMDSFLTLHSGTSTPSYAKQGTLWLDTSGSPLLVKMHDGTNDITIGQLDASNNIFKSASYLSAGYDTDAVGTDAYAINPDVAVSSLVEGMRFVFKVGTANTGAATLNVSGTGAVPLKKNYDEDLVTGDIVANQIIEVVYDGTNYQVVSPLGGSNVPTGSITAYGSSSAPTGWLVCDGSAVSRSTYSGLFNIIGTSYGSGDGSTTFNLPDLVGRVPVGLDSGGSRVSSNNTIGDSSGDETHTLSKSELPATGLNSSSGSGFVVTPSGVASNAVDSTGTGATAFSGGITLSKNARTENMGSGDAHNNMQPYQIVQYIIKI